MRGDAIEASGFDASAFDPATGAGKLSLNFAPGAAGEYFIAAFFDLDFIALLDRYRTLQQA